MLILAWVERLHIQNLRFTIYNYNFSQWTPVIGSVTSRSSIKLLYFVFLFYWSNIFQMFLLKRKKWWNFPITLSKHICWYCGFCCKFVECNSSLHRFINLIYTICVIEKLIYSEYRWIDRKELSIYLCIGDQPNKAYSCLIPYFYGIF